MARYRNVGILAVATVPPGFDRQGWGMSDMLASVSTGAAAVAPRTRISIVAVAIFASAVLVLPAVWNGFPLVFHDSGGYLGTFMNRELGFGRSAAYGAFMAAGQPLSFWPIIVVQAAVGAWMVLTTLRAHGIVRPAVTASIIVFLAVATSLPWYTAQLMPDVWAALAALGLYLVAFRRVSSLTERLLLVAVIAFAIAGHMATLALVLGLLVVLVAARLAAPRLGFESPSLGWPAMALLAGIVTALASNAVITGRFAFTPGGGNFLFARLVHTGIAARWLADHCPDPTIELCAFRHRLPVLGEDWLWEFDSPLNRDLGGWEAFSPDARHIVLDSLTDYPLAHAGAAVAGTAEQFVRFGSGDGIVSWTWHTHYEFERLAPDLVPAFKAARQQQEGFDLSPLNLLHVPVGFAALLGLGAVIVAARRRRLDASAATLAGFVLVVLVGNAAICGALSIPNDRYQSRVVWLAPFAVAVALAGSRRPIEAASSAQAEA